MAFKITVAGLLALLLLLVGAAEASVSGGQPVTPSHAVAGCCRLSLPQTF